MATDHLVQHLQQDVPDVLQRLEPVIDHVYRNYLHDALDATRKHWYVALTTQYLIQHLLTVYQRRVGQAAVADPLGAGPINATLEKTVAEGYAGTAWDTFVRRLAVAYPRPADKYLGPLVSRLRGVNQPVISTRNAFSTPRLTPLACV